MTLDVLLLLLIPRHIALFVAFFLQGPLFSFINVSLRKQTACRKLVRRQRA